MEHVKEAIARADLERSAPATKAKPPSTTGSNPSDTFGLEVYTDELRDAVLAAHAFLEAAQSDSPIWLSLLGNCGAGKTHLATELYRRFNPRTIRLHDPGSMGGRDHRQKKQKFHWGKVVKIMRNGDFGIVDYICDDIDFAVIDDLGAGYDSELTKAKAAEIAERRIGKPTVWTSNLDLGQIADQIDARLTSRLLRHGSKVVLFDKTKDWGVLQFQRGK